jgi:hypothetical protein
MIVPLQRLAALALGNLGPDAAIYIRRGLSSTLRGVKVNALIALSMEPSEPWKKAFLPNAKVLGHDRDPVVRQYAHLAIFNLSGS